MMNFNDVNGIFQDKKKVQEYNRLVMLEKEAQKKKEKFFNNGSCVELPYYRQGTKPTYGNNQKHPGTFWNCGQMFVKDTGFRDRHNGICVDKQKGIDLYNIPQQAYFDAMYNVDPYKIPVNSRRSEAIVKGNIYWNKKYEFIPNCMNIPLQAKVEGMDGKKIYERKIHHFQNGLKEVRTPLDISRSIRLKNNLYFNNKIPNNVIVYDKQKDFQYNHGNDGKPFNDGGKYKYKVGDKEVWGAPIKGDLAHKIDRETVEYVGDPVGLYKRKLKKAAEKYKGYTNKPAGNPNKYDLSGMNKAMYVYKDDPHSIYSMEYQNRGPGQRITIQRQKDMRYVNNGDFIGKTEHKDNFDQKEFDKRKYFYKDNYPQRCYQGFNGGANELYNNGYFLQDANAKMKHLYKVYPIDARNFQGSNHILNNPYAPLGSSVRSKMEEYSRKVRANNLEANYNNETVSTIGEENSCGCGY